MKANELMIGDWCILGNGQYAQIDTVLFKILLEYEIDGNKNDLRHIPLTPEILEKNGFVAEFASEDYRYDDKMILTQSYDKKGYWWVVGNMYVCQLHYVHELQHALRLCGLNELADNFKLQ